MKRKIAALVIACLFLSGLSVHAQPSLVRLKWLLAPQNDVLYTASQVAGTGLHTGGWIRAVVPGTVFYAYVAAGRERNPDFGENIYKVDKANYNRPYWYRAEFAASGLPAGKRIWLNFAGINKRGEIYVNGRHIGTVDGLMRRAQYDITSMIKRRKPNVIAVLVFTPTPGVDLANRQAPTYLSSGSWDWMPAVPGLNSGITDEVTLTATGPVTVADPWIRADFPNKAIADLTVRVKLINAIGSPATGRLRVTINPGNITVLTPAITLNAHTSQLVELDQSGYPQLRIQHPKLWWPNGYGGKPDGTQYLYTCTAAFEIAGGKKSDIAVKSFGIRKITADTTALNGPLRVYVNDVPILIKGGNWGMSDYMLKVRGKDYDTRIRFHQAMNFNMIRNWTGEVTDEAFYNACDRYGIMVWDDFWLNNFGQIDSLIVFKANDIEKVKRLRNHPSVVIWCGANEGVPGGDPKGPLNQAIEDAVTTYDGNDRLYLPRSNAGVNNPNFSVHGGSRILSGSGIWGNVDPKTYFTDPHNGYLFSKDNYGLRSELGTATFVNIESFKKFMPRDYWVAPTPEAVDSKTNLWARHYFSTDGALGGGSQPVKYINDITKSYGKAASLEDFCRKAQLLNVETTKAMYEAWNDHMWHNASGILLWMSQSAYPSMIWQTYDYYYDLTGAYFGAKTACEPVHIQWNPATNAVKVINNKPYAIKGLVAQADVYNMDGLRVPGYSQKINLQANATSATYAFTVFNDSSRSAKLSAVHFLKLKLADAGGRVLSENFYWTGNTYLDNQALNQMPPVAQSLQVSRPVITIAANGANRVLTYHITNHSKTTAAFAIRAQLLNHAGKQILPALFSDGYFSLMQGESKTLSVEVDPKILGNDYKLDVKPYNN
jgi:hypothetical protein